MAMNYYIVYWRAPRPEREEGTSLVYALSKQAAHKIVRNAATLIGVDALIPSYAELLTPTLSFSLNINDSTLAEVRTKSHVILERRPNGT